jgi:hypothetical protein
MKTKSVLMHPTEKLIRNLANLARRAPQEPAEAPYGFATRVIAQLHEAETRDWTLWLLPRATAVAALISLAALGYRYEAKPAADFHDLAAAEVQSALEHGL